MTQALDPHVSFRLYDVRATHSISILTICQGIACTLDLIHGSMSVRTTRKAYDPYIILKARDMIKLLARGVAVGQAVKILNDDVACDIIKIDNVVRNKERFVKRRQRIIGPDGSTLKVCDIYAYIERPLKVFAGHRTSYPVLCPRAGKYCKRDGSIQRSKGGPEDCLRLHEKYPSYIPHQGASPSHAQLRLLTSMKELMIKRELAKDPQLATESWDRFLPKFRKKHLKTSEKTARKNERIQEKNEARKAAGLPSLEEAKKEKKEKKVYTPFPPPQQPRKVDLQLESGEYFLKAHEKEAREAKKRKEKVSHSCLYPSSRHLMNPLQQEEVTAERRAKRAEAFVAPDEDAALTVEEKRKRKHARVEEEVNLGDSTKKKKKRKADSSS